MMGLIAKPVGGLIVLLTLISLGLSMMPFMKVFAGGEVYNAIQSLADNFWWLIPLGGVLFYWGMAPPHKLMIAFIVMVIVLYVISHPAIVGGAS